MALLLFDIVLCSPAKSAALYELDEAEQLVNLCIESTGFSWHFSCFRKIPRRAEIAPWEHRLRIKCRKNVNHKRERPMTLLCS